MTDSISTGDIKDSKGVAIGEGAQVNYEEHHHYPAPAEEKPTFPIHQIPFPQNPNFTGREEILQQVADTLNAGQTTIVTQTIAGLGGVGKTQLALAYCYAHLGDYDLIYWLSANSEPGLGKSLMALARRLKLIAPIVTDQQLAVQAVQHFLSQTNLRWLLVYDNADQIEPRQLTPYLPRTGNGHVLITSQNPNYGGVGEVMELGLFSLDEAVKYLFQRKGAEAQRGSKEWQEAAALAEELGRFPLALEHAAAYVESKDSSYATYHRLFTNRRTELWSRAEAPDSYHATITTTWELAFDEVKKTPGALDLLNLCCFLDPESIPLDLIKQIADIETQHAESFQAIVADELTLDDAIGALRRYSLMQRTDNKLSLHRLVQAVVLDRLGEARAPQWVKVVIDLLDRAYNYDPMDTSTWIACGNLISHLVIALELGQRYECETHNSAKLNNEGGRFLWQTGSLQSAKVFVERGASIYVKLEGVSHAFTATSFNNLGVLLQAMGDHTAAKQFLEKAFEIRKDIFDSDHPDVAQSFHNLGSLFRDMGKYKEAQSYFEHALNIQETILPPDHPDIAQSLNSLGGLYQTIGELNKAKPLLDRALAIRKNSLGLNHPDTATSLDNMGSLLRELGEQDKAQSLIEGALAIRKEVHGINHPDTASSFNNLGFILYNKGELNEARLCWESALSIREKVLGPNHPLTAASLNNLGAFLKEMGDLVATRQYYERALHIWINVLGPDHPIVAYGINNLATLSYSEQDYVEAARLMRQALAIREKRLGLAHPLTDSSRESLAIIEAKLP